MRRILAEVVQVPRSASLTPAICATVVVAIALLTPAAAGAHTTRYTNPSATSTSGDCPIAMPCKIAYAINGSSDGDEVIVAPGSYTISTPLDAPAIDLHGVAGQAAPELAGTSNLGGDVLTFERGGTVRHLRLRGASPADDALSLQKGRAEDLTIVAVAGDGAKVMTDSGATVLRDSVVVAEASGSGPAALKLREGSGGALAVRNVVALAPDANAIRCEVTSSQQATIVNVVARGLHGDIDATNGGGGCRASNTNLRPALSPALALGTGIQSGDPLLGADQQPLDGSPLIDAGAADEQTTAADPDGRARTVPDIGVYEGTGTPGKITPVTPGQNQAPAPEPPVRGIPAPVLGETVVVAPGQGKVLVRRPGARRFRKLGSAALLPSGTIVDARRGRIRLTTALDVAGKFQTGRFWGSHFQIRQGHGARGMTSLTLRGGDFGRCPARASSLAHASGVARENPTTRRVVRRLWARDRGGRFRTYGNNSVATARGTAWVTKDRCDGTVTRVREGAVAIKDRRTGRTVILRAGGSYLARR